MQLEQLGARLIGHGARHSDGAAGEALVLAAVVEVVEQVAADPEGVVGRVMVTWPTS